MLHAYPCLPSFMFYQSLWFKTHNAILLTPYITPWNLLPHDLVALMLFNPGDRLFHSRNCISHYVSSEMSIINYFGSLYFCLGLPLSFSHPLYIPFPLLILWRRCSSSELGQYLRTLPICKIGECIWFNNQCLWLQGIRVAARATISINEGGHRTFKMWMDNWGKVCEDNHNLEREPYLQCSEMN